MSDAGLEKVYTIRRRHLLRGAEFAVVFGERWVIIRNVVRRWVGGQREMLRLRTGGYTDRWLL